MVDGCRHLFRDSFTSSALSILPLVAHENIDSTDAERGQMRWSFRLITEARPERKLHIILELKKQPRIARRLMDAGSQSLAELGECLFGKLQLRWQARYLWLVAE